MKVARHVVPGTSLDKYEASGHQSDKASETPRQALSLIKKKLVPTQPQKPTIAKSDSGSSSGQSEGKKRKKKKTKRKKDKEWFIPNMSNNHKTFINHGCKLDPQGYPLYPNGQTTFVQLPGKDITNFGSTAFVKRHNGNSQANGKWKVWC